jgi:eukaryotic-like serine/threonine-protein kinase
LISHKNLKPTNLMLDNVTRAVRVTDLGLALFNAASNPSARNASERFTESGSNTATPGYLAPEQAYGSRRVDHRADVCSLGYTLYFLLTGQEPFPPGTAPARLPARVDRPAPLLRTARPDLPAVLEAAYLRMVGDTPTLTSKTS